MSPAVVDDAPRLDDMPLPDAASPSLALVHPTPEEKLSILKLNVVPWRGPLSVSAYLERENFLFGQPLTKDGGITHWALVDTSVPRESRRILASCESIRKKAFVAVTTEDGRVQVDQVLSHGVGSVFCDPALRGRKYAGRMMKELGKKLRTWQIDEKVPGRKRCLFSVLYSDIGKKFYSSNGWHPFPSTHIALPPLSADIHIDTSQLPPTRDLHTQDLSTLCSADEALMRRDLTTHSSNHKFRVALIPDVETMSWHHAREEFVAQQIFNRKPEIKGAIVGDQAGSRAWVIWARVWGNELGAEDPDHKLYILRLVVEGRNAAKRTENGSVPTSASTDAHHDKNQRDMIKSLLVAAQLEAGRWKLKEVHLWNPTEQAVLAVQEAHELTAPPANTAVKVIDRDSESIASLMWYGHDRDDLGRNSRSEVEWIGNEKYGWC
ncbi:MAG: hypothetical protein M4579_001294 [Chaenotheca gracillima]|nr:MAG: hypothetical protein M4579_001294 [Chaenotheca gracillima]